MSGVLRLSNNVTGRSTIIASASNDQTFTLPATGGTLLAGGSSLEVIFPSGTEALPGLHVESDVNTGLYSPAANTLGISTDGTEAMRIDSSGRVGIGTSTPASILHCASSGDDNIRVVANGKTAQLGVDGGTPFVGTPSGAFNFYANGNLAATLDSSGRLLVGTSSTNGSFNSAIQIAGSGVAGTQLISRFDNNAGAPNLYFAKSRGASVGTNTLVQSGDEVGNIGFYAADGTNYVPAAQIRVDVDGTPGTSDMPGRLVFSTTADGASSPTERLRIDSSGNVGIGNTTCGSILDVRTGAAGSQNAITMGYGRSANPTDAIHKIQWASDDLVIAADTGNTITSNIIFKNDNTERMRIDSSGRVGIGTTSPARQLTVYNSSAPVFQLVNSTTGQTANDGVLLYESGSNFVIENQEAGEIKIYNNGSQRATIDSSGRLLVGTSSAVSGGEPSNALLQVVGRAGAPTDLARFTLARGNAATNLGSGSEVGNIYFTDNAGNTFSEISTVVDGTTGTNDYPGRLVFSTTADGASSPTERMRINSNGTFHFSTNGSYTNAGGTYNEIYQTNESVVCLYARSTSTNPYGYQIFYDQAKNNTGNEFLYCSDASAQRAAIRSNGGLANYQSNNINLCDEREKKNIVSLDTKWDKVKSWELTKFHYNEDADTDDKRYGVIAQQVEEHCPEVLTEWIKRKAADAVLDDEGNVVTPAQEEILRKGVKEQQMMWMAIKALQEAMERIETLEIEVASLRSN